LSEHATVEDESKSNAATFNEAFRRFDSWLQEAKHLSHKQAVRVAFITGWMAREAEPAPDVNTLPAPCPHADLKASANVLLMRSFSDCG
jgi:hypothetical protein